MLIIDYKTVYSIENGELDELVRKLISEGWQPFGNQYEDSNGTYNQPMVKFKPFAIENGIVTNLPISMGM